MLPDLRGEDALGFWNRACRMWIDYLSSLGSEGWKVVAFGGPEHGEPGFVLMREL